MYMEIPELTARAVKNGLENNISLHQSELSVIGFDHAMVGAELVAGWNLPASMYDALCYHHRPSLSLNYSDDAAIVHVSDLVVNALQLGTSGELDIPQLDELAWEHLELSQFVLPNAIEQLDFQFSEAVKLFLEE
ncbi:MAG: HDOD domain-containing protein [Gammaproteobacteria bacterium]|nr:HDOD domain-containing protein [Gammaproteobacteria bacterium]